MNQTGKETAIAEARNKKRSIALKLTLITRQLRTRFDQRAESIGLSGAKWTLIAVVSRHPGATQRTVASLLGVTEVTAGRLIDKLCADGYLERREHESDRRAYCVHLTKAAKPLLKQLGGIATALEAEAFAGISEKDLALFDALMDRLARNVVDERSLLEAENGLHTKKA